VTNLITSPSNPLVKEIAGLKRRRRRNQTGRFLVEGRRELRHALDAGRVAFDRIVVSDSLIGSGAEPFLTDAAARSITVTRLGPDAFRHISMREHPDGVAGVAMATSFSLEQLDTGGIDRVLVIDGIEKPGNLGAVLRTADAAGMDAVIVTGGGADLGNPNVIRASQGAVFDLPIAHVSTPTAVSWLAALGLRIVVATPEADRELWDADLTGMVALVVGSEHAGVSHVLKNVATLVRIPMVGAADSLNASVAAALVMYEAVRQAR
jgi:TrmH family RNA methyltransferase